MLNRIFMVDGLIVDGPGAGTQLRRCPLPLDCP